MLALLNRISSISYLAVSKIDVDFEVEDITTVLPTSGNTAINISNFPGLTSSNVTITISTSSPVDILIPATMYSG